MSDTPYRKKLVEAVLPLEAINDACKADKVRSLGTIRNIHKWFAPMPVPALRALIFASLVDDPDDDTERNRLLRIMESLVASGTFSPPAAVLDEAKAAIRSSVGSAVPIVLDPFCGGGSTLVEAQRLGLRGRGSDYNPIPVLITKALTEFPPRIANRPPLHRNADGELPMMEASGLQGFISDVRHYAKRVYDEARIELNSHYPPGPDGNPIVAWIWARTVPSPDPRFQGAHTPLITNLWLSRKKGERAYLQPLVEDGEVHFKIQSSGAPPPATKDHCLLSSAPISFSYVREQAQRGLMGEVLLAMITQGPHERSYFIADEVQVKAAASADTLEGISDLALPDEALGFRIQGYGMTEWSDLFTPRQQLCLSTFAHLVSRLPTWINADGGDEVYAKAITTVLGLCVGKLSRVSSKLVGWRTRDGQSKAEPAFGQHIVPMTWDWSETNPFGGSVGDWMQVVDTTVRAFECVDPSGPPATVTQSDARTAGKDFNGTALVLTDPPYFAAIGYANLSDYFYLWIRAALKEVYPELLATIATPKADELIAEPGRHENSEASKQYFIDGFTDTFTSLLQASRPDLPLLIVYAYKEQEAERDAHVSAGWEAMLEAVIRSGLSIVGTWPIHGTGSSRMRGKNSNALATYVVLVCRPLLSTSVRVSRRDLVTALRSELAPAIEVLQSAAVAPVDLAQAVIGPGMAVFTRYQSVLEQDGTPMTVRSALLLINSRLGRSSR